MILAGGVGARVGLDVPKQLLKIAGKSILEHTIAVFHASENVDEIIVAMAPGHLDAVHELLRSGAYPKVHHVLEGAGTRHGTTLKALNVIDDASLVLVHDAVRPLVSSRIIDDCFAALVDYEAVDVAIRSADTIIEVDEQQLIKNIPSRPSLRRGQTPQGFRAGTLKRAYALAAAELDSGDAQATDNCSIVLRYLPEVRIRVVPGEERNMKVTEPIDVYIADKLFQLANRVASPQRTEEEYRAELAGRTVVIFGGSYGIGAEIAALAGDLGARVFSFSRSTTRTHVERREDVTAALRAVLAETDRVDYVVNAAGVLPIGDLVESSEEDVYNATEINYLGPIFIGQTFFQHLSASGGSLLLFTSSSYTRGRRGYSLYSSAKAAIVNLTQALADEWEPAGVRVNCINPERTGTPMRTKAFGEEPAGSLLRSETVARASLDVLLSSDTGHIIDVRRLDPLASHAAAAELAETTDGGDA